MKHSETNAEGEPPTVAAEWVLASKFEELTGVTRETVKQRKKCGVWREGIQVAVVRRRLRQARPPGRLPDEHDQARHTSDRMPQSACGACLGLGR